MKNTIVIVMLLFICSCNNNVKESYTNKSKNMTKQDEIIMSMRLSYIDEIESAFELMGQLQEEFDRMKSDYFYKLSNQERTLFTVPGPGWKLEGPLDPNSLDVEKYKNYQIEDNNNYNKSMLEYIKFCRNHKEGDELYIYKSDDLSWSYMRGNEGYIIVRDNKVIDKFVTGMN